MRCLICHEETIPKITWTNFWSLPEKEVLCIVCRSMFQPLKPGCPLCFREGEKGVCEDCQWWEQTHPGLLAKNTSVFQYNEFAKDFVARWKYRGDYILLEALQWHVVEHFSRMRNSDYIIAPIPLSEERSYERGFNQSEAIIDLLNQRPHSLLERRNSEKQSKKGRYARITSNNPFKLIQSVRQPVMLVDDIYTTGTTVRHAASLLKQAGCPAVTSFTIFR
ncbi:competence protein ComFC [Halobacillus alkaliphilus]|uniref:Competence protein ComFC n=1 Tax=Halobacillus alkaliphilus TaxID=396056 RepID=A0A1I2KRZ6_9BACI|nr:ComF family protein [Halobacillus alkaliphilus]SFF67891.1 competence protein ComFC [Halobacillus alkaliphilus]